MRSLKIQPKFRARQIGEARVPEIILRGNWLEKLGFKIYRRVSVKTRNKMLVIRLEE